MFLRWDVRAGVRERTTYHRDAFIVRDGAYGPCTIPPDAGYLVLHVLRVGWKATVEFVYDFLGTAEQTGCARVISEAFPQSIYRVYVRSSLCDENISRRVWLGLAVHSRGLEWLGT